MGAEGKAWGKGTRGAGAKAGARPAPSSAKSRAKGGRRAGSQGRGAKYLTPFDRVDRAGRIAVARSKAKPDPWRAIADRENLDERTCQRIYDDWLLWKRNRASPDRLIDHTIEMIEAQILDLDDAIAMARDLKNVASWVGALRLQMEAVAARWEVMRNAGRLPASMTRWREGEEAQVIFAAMMRVLSGRVEQGLIDELLAVVDDEPRVIEGPAADADAMAGGESRAVEGASS
jgi:hypothetical protein